MLNKQLESQSNVDLFGAQGTFATFGSDGCIGLTSGSRLTLLACRQSSHLDLVAVAIILVYIYIYIYT